MLNKAELKHSKRDVKRTESAHTHPNHDPNTPLESEQQWPAYLGVIPVIISMLRPDLLKADVWKHFYNVDGDN